MTRVFVLLSLFLSLFLGALAAPALAQSDDDGDDAPYGDDDDDDDGDDDDGDDDRDDDVDDDDDADVTTPCSTIFVTGDSWEPGTVITIDREFDSDDCPGDDDDDDAPDVNATLQPDDGGRAGARASLRDGMTVRNGKTTVPVGEDGSFSAVLVVPADVPAGALEFTVTGVDDAGQPRAESHTYDVAPGLSFQSADSAPGSTTRANVAVILLAVIIGGLLVNQFRLRRASGRR